ncbi:unnamed protein product [Acanthoscelides obtectus]|uniref:C2H2-type domain-containing protein n=1 Tax=Acanthoscelides obtectus TaxID=200917 RepID=A0A9P0MDE5_ACAOB|nr:unnamed protein product [Acanthoscelides obtectus]CAK1670806.1 Zinc finger protein 711 [Acanthoscelides obtectus]
MGKCKEKGLEVMHGEAVRELFICYTCNYETNCRAELIRHLGEEKYGSNKSADVLNICVHCKASFVKSESLDDHIIRKHPDFVTSVSRKIYECPNCTFKSVSKYKIPSHMRRVHSDTNSSFYVCTHCKSTFKKAESLDDHIVKIHPTFISSVKRKIYECTRCPLKTVWKGKLEKHMMKTHLNLLVGNLINPCSSCDKVFKNKQSLDEHILKKHPDRFWSITRKIFECPICQFQTIARDKLQRHRMVHHPNTASNLFISCMHCDSVFKTKDMLDDHIVRKHPDFIASVSRKIHQCPKCPFKTVIKYKIDGHTRSYHPDSNSLLHTCAHCKSTFKKRESLDDHIVRVHPTFVSSVKRKIHECTKCEYKTISKRTLERHMMGTHPKAASSLFVSCVHCDKLFKRKVALDEHLLQKHPDCSDSVARKIFECPNCPFKTVVKSMLGRHTMKCTPKSSSRMKQSKQTNASYKQSTHRKPNFYLYII